MLPTACLALGITKDAYFGTGTIVGIVFGAVAILGIGGFVLFWFVIKKKSFADLVAVFKKKSLKNA